VLPDRVRAVLAGDLPPALLVTGPGSGSVVSEACAVRGWTFLDSLNAAMARQVRDEAWLAPDGGLRVTALNLTGASDQVQNMLLKVLEEPPPGNRFVLCSEQRLLFTVVSRCQVLVVSPEGVNSAPEPRELLAVGSAIRAARSGDSSLLASAVRDWTPVHARLLSQWAAEAAAGRWKFFSAASAPGVSPEQALRLLQELSRRRGSRLGPVVALQQAFPRR
jgi:hypothetical protein